MGRGSLREETEQGREAEAKGGEGRARGVPFVSFTNSPFNFISFIFGRGRRLSTT